MSAPEPCAYLPDRLAQLRYELAPDLTAAEFMVRLQEGWRRFGPVMFRHACASCRMCQSLRVPVRTFQATRSQRRAWRMNHHEVTLQIGSPAASPDVVDLFTRFQRHGADTKGWPERDAPDLRLFVQNPFPTEEWRYYLGERLVGVGYVDALPEGLSAIYFVHDPEEHRRGLGTFNILALIQAAGERNLPHVYLGYYVEGCRSLEYKARFAPNEVLTGEGTWGRGAAR